VISFETTLFTSATGDDDTQAVSTVPTSKRPTVRNYGNGTVAAGG